MVSRLIIALLIITQTAPALASASRDHPFVAGFILGMGASSAGGNRVAADGTGAAVRGEFGYSPAAAWMVPYVTAAMTWARGDAPEWEKGGYVEPAYYLGLYSRQVSLGGLYRYRFGGGRLTAGGGPAFVYADVRREALTFDGFSMEDRNGDGLGWGAHGGLEFALAEGAAQTVGIQAHYTRAYGDWDGLPTGADTAFIFEQTVFAIAFRFYF